VPYSDVQQRRDLTNAVCDASRGEAAWRTERHGVEPIRSVMPSKERQSKDLTSYRMAANCWAMGRAELWSDVTISEGLGTV